MTKVITYGTFDLLHYGHLRLLERAKALGDYLVVGITADGFDMERGKINVQQSLIERIEGVKATGLANKIIVEEYQGQKIDDIKRYGIDIFTVGSDWTGKFDYLKEYCKVVYLDRTQGISSTEIRTGKRDLALGLMGDSPTIRKIEHESHFVNGITVSGICTTLEKKNLPAELAALPCVTNDIDELFENCEAVYIITPPLKHYNDIKRAIEMGKHVICESPIAVNTSEWKELQDMAKKRKLVVMDSLKTAYSMAYYRLLLLAKSGMIGKIVSVDSTCTSLADAPPVPKNGNVNPWNSICSWGPTAMLPIFQLLGNDFKAKTIATHIVEGTKYDTFTKISFLYPHAVASLKVGQNIKSEGELVVSGTRGYIYVPAPWWKTEYFEVRYENPADNKRYFYQLDGEGLRYELLSFVKTIISGNNFSYLSPNVSLKIVEIIEDFYNGKDVVEI